MMELPRFRGASALRRALEPIERLTGGLVPLGTAAESLEALLGDPLARLFAPPPGEATLALALAGLGIWSPPAAPGRRPARPAPAVGPPLRPAASPLAQALRRAAAGSPRRPAASSLAQAVRATAGMYGASSPASALLGSFAPPPRVKERPRSGAGSALAPALEAFTRRVAGGKSAAASLLAPDGVTDVLADALAAAAAVAVGVGEAAAVATSTAVEKRAASSGPASPLAALGHLAAGAAAHLAAVSHPLAATARDGGRDGGIAELVRAALGGDAAPAGRAGLEEQDLERLLRALGSRPHDDDDVPALTAVGGPLGGQLGVLMRRWQADTGEVAVRTARHQAPSLPAHIDTETFARTLERVLTAEARRHGITVESG